MAFSPPSRHAHRLAALAAPMLALAFSLSISLHPHVHVHAQAVPASAPNATPPAANPADPPPPVNPTQIFLGDTKRFTRFGGWGSVGAGIGRYGFARTTLVMLPPVQKELDLSEEQLQKIRDWLETMRKKGEDLGRNLRDQAQQNGQNLDPAAQANVPIPVRMLQFTTMMNQISNLARENEAGLARILTKPQRQRLDEISLQMEGISAILRPDIADRVNLSPAQRERIALLLAQSQNQQLAVWIEQSVAMAAQRGSRSQPPAKGSKPDQSAPPSAPSPKAATPRPNQNLDDHDDNLPPPPPAAGPNPADPARAERFRQFQTQFTSLREKTDLLQDRTTREVLKLLTSRQRSTLDKLFGEPFDPQSLNNLSRPAPNPATSNSPQISRSDPE
jgi:hypothetical protein